MTEINPSVDKKVQLDLQLQASDGLKQLVKEFIKPEIRSAFAERILYLTLRPEMPISVAVDKVRVSLIDPDMNKIIAAYTSNVEDISSRVHMYNRSLHLAPEVGIYEYPDGVRGVNLRFKLALTAIEANNLFAPPFDSVDGDRAYIVTNIPGAVLGPDDERPDVLEGVRRQLGVTNDKGAQSDKAPDQYYVSRPVIKRRHIDMTTE